MCDSIKYVLFLLLSNTELSAILNTPMAQNKHDDTVPSKGKYRLFDQSLGADIGHRELI